MSNKIMSTLAVAAFLLLGSLCSRADDTAFPLKVSDNGRYFVDQNGAPFFWMATTQWPLFSGYTVDEAKTILERAKANGFNVIQVKLLGNAEGRKPNTKGDVPMSNVDPLTPNEAYFKGVDAVVEDARKKNLMIAMTLYHQRWHEQITEKNARGYAKWLANRYKDAPNIFWTMTPQAKPEYLPVLRELAAGLKEGDGGKHLITFKPDPAPYSSSFAHDEPWLACDCIQVWKDVDLIYPFIAKDYALTPTKPVLMIEGAYEAGEEYGFDVTPLWVRRQAYYTYLAGAFHGYGHNDAWRIHPTWKGSLDAPAAKQMAILKRFFTDLKEWWNLVPDQSLLASGGQTEGKVLNLAARHKDGLWAVVYLGDPATVSVDLSKLAGKDVKASWFDPRTGVSMSLGRLSNSGVKEFSTPDGWEDAALLLEASTGP